MATSNVLSSKEHEMEVMETEREKQKPTIVAIAGAYFSNSNFHKTYYRHIVVVLFCCTYSVVGLLFSFRNDFPENHQDTWNWSEKKKTEKKIYE